MSLGGLTPESSWQDLAEFMIASPPVINVLWLVDHLGFKERIHGAGMFYLNVIPAFPKDKFNPILCVIRGKDLLHKYVENRRIEKVYYLDRGKYDPLTFFDLVQIIRKEKIDILHLHGFGADNFGRLARVFFKIPTIVHTHDPAVYYPWFQRCLDRILAPCVDSALAVSRSIRSATAAKRKILLEKIEVLHTCTPLEDFKSATPSEVSVTKKELGIGLDYKIVTTVARLFEQKGTEYLIRSLPAVLEQFPKTILLVVGDGPLRGDLEALTRDLKLRKSVIFAGHREDVRRILSVSDIKVLPSLWEGTPLTMLEAMAMGKPIVATTVDGIMEVLRDGETAFLVSPRDPKALAEKILKLLTNEKEAVRLGLNAMAESKKYDVGFCVGKLERLYCALFESRRRS